MAKKLKNKRTVQAVIPFTGADKETDIIKTGKDTYSLTLNFTDINYQISREEDQEEVFDKYSKLINYFSDDFEVGINIINKPIDLGDIEKDILIKHKGDGLDIYRDEYNKIVADGLKSGKGNMKKELYMTVSTKAKNYEEANKKLDKVNKEIINGLKTIGSNARILSLEERLEAMHDYFNPDEAGLFKAGEVNTVKRHGLTVKNLIAPESFEFKSNYFKIGEKFARGLFIRVFPDSINDAFIDELIGTNLNMSISIHLRSMDKGKAISLARRQKSNMEAETIGREKKAIDNKSLEVRVPEELKEAYESAVQLLENLKKSNDKMFFTTISIVHIADTKEDLEEATEALKAIANQHGVKLGTLVEQQEEAMVNSLPLAINKLFVDRLLTTSEVSIFTPFGTQELLESDGSYYGKNSASGNTLLFNRKNLKAGHGFVLGTTGSGKSFYCKEEITNIMLTTCDDIVIIDPMGEYEPFVRELGGEVIKISTNSKNYINALEISENYGGDSQDAFLLKSEFVISMLNKLLGGHSGLTAVEMSIIDRCVSQVYRPYIASGYKKEALPTMLEFQECLNKQEEKEAKNLATSLEIYSKGSLSIFAKPTNVNINNRLVCFDLRDLGEQLQGLAYLVVLDSILNRLSNNKNKGVYTRLYADEFHVLTKNAQACSFFIKLYKMARKMGGIVTALTQQVSDVLANEELATTLSNSEFIILLSQGARERKTLAELLNISKTQLSFITNARVGSGLMVLGETSIIPFQNIIDTRTKLYKLMSTKVSDHVEEVV